MAIKIIKRDVIKVKYEADGEIGYILVAPFSAVDRRRVMVETSYDKLMVSAVKARTALKAAEEKGEPCNYVVSEADISLQTEFVARVLRTQLRGWEGFDVTDADGKAIECNYDNLMAVLSDDFNFLTTVAMSAVLGATPEELTKRAENQGNLPVT